MAPIAAQFLAVRAFFAALAAAAALGFGTAAFLSRKAQPLTALATVGTVPTAGYEGTALSDRFVVYAVPMFDDNYAWLIADRSTKQCAVVDPGDAAPVLEAVAALGLRLTRVLITHKHGDHIGGISHLKTQARTGVLEIIGTAYEHIYGLDVGVNEGDQFDLFGDPDHSFKVTVISTPCHTKGHIVFFVELSCPNSKPALFCGDTLFLAGCGRFFEGDARQMYEALVLKIGRLPPETLVFCAHEYSSSNLHFAARVEPTNPALRAKVEWVDERRRLGLPSVPSTLAEERQYNPFVRCGHPDVMARMGAHDPVDCMHRLREAKNTGRF